MCGFECRCACHVSSTQWIDCLRPAPFVVGTRKMPVTLVTGSQPLSTTMSDITLNCWVIGDDPQQVFQVNIKENQTIYSLKRHIKALKNYSLPANSLTLWKVSIDFEDFEIKLGSIQQPESVDNAQILWPLEVLAEHFTIPLPPKHIHIIVQRECVWHFCLHSLTVLFPFGLLTLPTPRTRSLARCSPPLSVFRLAHFNCTFSFLPRLPFPSHVLPFYWFPLPLALTYLFTSRLCLPITATLASKKCPFVIRVNSDPFHHLPVIASGSSRSNSVARVCLWCIKIVDSGVELDSQLNT
jgi:Crinkler effector protein N-terminal domain